MIASPATLEVLRMADQPGVGSVALRRYIEDRANGVVEQPSTSGKSMRDTDRTKQARYDDILRSCEAEGIAILSPLDKNYPHLLRLIKDYPPIIYVKGDQKCLTRTAFAVVGTRNASRLGASWAKQIAELFATRGLTVVSGLALGIDSSAHNGAVLAGGVTVAILAHGLDQITPSSNRGLADEIIRTGGCLLSEHPPKTPPRKPEYVRRNRLQSGMSVGSIIVESGFEGGSMHQAKFTVDQNRALFTVLPSGDTEGVGEFSSEGPLRLVSEFKAMAIRGRSDLIKLFDQEFFSKKEKCLLENRERSTLL